MQIQDSFNVIMVQGETEWKTQQKNENKSLRGSWKKYLVWRGVKLQIGSRKKKKIIIII